MKHENLFTPFTIGKVTINNRLVLSPMSMPTGIVNNSEWTDSYIDFLVDRAKGGAGLIYTGCITSDTHVDPIGATGLYPTMHPEKFIASSKKLLDRCHAEGTKVFCQITAGIGRNGEPGTKTPSPLPYTMTPQIISEALTREEIRQKVVDMAASAAVIKEAGYDGIELHALHWGYLFDNFALAIMNQRTDEYGGTLENRMRFIKESIYAVRQAVGPDFPISIRLAVKTFIQGLMIPSLDENVERGRTPEEAAEIGKMLESYGVDVISADMGLYDNWVFAMPGTYLPSGITLKYIEPLKQAVNIPVLCGGCRMADPDEASQAIQAGLCDAVVIGRGFLAEPDLGTKIKEGRSDEIRPCIGCNHCLLSEAIDGKARCAVNPVELSEESHIIQPADKKKKVVIVGGGVAGMEAAIVSRKRGHEVELFEKSDQLGGNLIPAGAHSFKEVINKLNRWYQAEMERQGVKVHLNQEMTAEAIKALNPDAVLLAVGSHPVMPKSIKGVENSIDVISAANGTIVPEGERVVIAGGGLTGCEIALDYAMAGKKVTIVEYEPALMSVGPPTFPTSMIYLLVNFMGRGVTMLTGHKVDEITENSVIVTDLSTGQQETIETDATVMAIGLKPIASMAPELAGEDFEVHELGDGVSIGNIFTATESAFKVARSL